MILNSVIVNQTPVEFFLPLCKFTPTILQEVKNKEEDIATFIICFQKVGYQHGMGSRPETLLVTLCSVRMASSGAKAPRPA